MDYQSVIHDLKIVGLQTYRLFPNLTFFKHNIKLDLKVSSSDRNYVLCTLFTEPASFSLF